jgi:hypothetical protein
VDQLLERTGVLKRMLVAFARSDRFELELSALIWQEFPDGQVAAESQINTIVDDFLLKHRLAGGSTVVEEFVLAHPELPDEERDLLLSWLNAVDGIFEVAGKERDAVLLLNVIDELTYRTRSNLGGMLRPVRKGMFVVGRVVPLGDDWLMSGYLSVLPASERDQLLTIAAVRALQHPEAVFRNPVKLAQARSALAQQRKIFVDLFGADLIVAPGPEVPERVKAFRDRLAGQKGSDALSRILAADFPDELLAAESVALHFATNEGLSFYPDYHLLEELFTNPELITSPDHREVLWGTLRAPDVSPEPLRRLAARDPAKASQVFTDLLWRNDGFSWSDDGEDLLRRSKPSYFDGTVLPQNVPLSPALTNAYQRAIQG